MDEPIEVLYFNWLCAKVLIQGNKNYYDLMQILYSTEFVWIVPGDENREEDGLELRQDFLRETQLDYDPGWFSEPCSVLEVLIAFAHRASFQTDLPEYDWFWHFLTNLKLNEYRRISKRDIPEIEEILYVFIWRTYDAYGDGGLFPLRTPKEDQRKVELWYQFFEYLEDQGLL